MSVCCDHVLIETLLRWPPAGAVGVVEDVWREVWLDLAVQDQVLQRLHAADLLAAPVQAQAACSGHRALGNRENLHQTVLGF